jgi:hypothetical protein
MYRRDWNDKAQEFKAHPADDWTTHYADAFRYFAVGHREVPAAYRRRPPRNNGWVV